MLLDEPPNETQIKLSIKTFRQISFSEKLLISLDELD